MSSEPAPAAIAPALLAWHDHCRPARSALAARSHALSRVGLGGDAAADAGGRGDSLFRALHGAVPRCARAGRCAHGRGAAPVVGPGLLRARPQPAARRAADARCSMAACFPRISTRGGAARHRSLHGRRHPRAVARPVASHPRWQCAARAGAPVRSAGPHRRARVRERAVAARQRCSRRGSAWRSTPRPSWIWAPRCARAASRAATSARWQTAAPAHAAGAEQDYPAPKQAAASAASARCGCCLRGAAMAAVRLVQRPAQGVWGGLWSPPEFASQAAAEQSLAASHGSLPALEPASRCCMCSRISIC